MRYIKTFFHSIWVILTAGWWLGKELSDATDKRKEREEDIIKSLRKMEREITKIRKENQEYRKKLMEKSK